MNCENCKSSKLLHEFPNVKDLDCDHPFSYCLLCLSELEVCPEESCAKKFSDQERQGLIAGAKLTTVAFDPRYSPQYNPSNATYDELTITMLDGTSSQIEATPTTKISDLRLRAAEGVGKEKNYVKLIYGTKELKDHEDGKETFCENYITGESRTLLLIVVMISIKAGDDLDKVLFHIHWDYPEAHEDMLDATCFCYDKTGKKLERVNYSHKKSADNAIKHSGDPAVDPKGQCGDHKIEVLVKSLKPECFKVFFTISAFVSRSLGKYRSVSVSLVDERRPTEELAPVFTLKNSTESKSVLLCYLSKIESGWEIIESGASLEGNATDYTPIETYLSSLCEGEKKKE